MTRKKGGELDITYLSCLRQSTCLRSWRISFVLNKSLPCSFLQNNEQSQLEKWIKFYYGLITVSEAFVKKRKGVCQLYFNFKKCITTIQKKKQGEEKKKLQEGLGKTRGELRSQRKREREGRERWAAFYFNSQYDTSHTGPWLFVTPFVFCAGNIFHPQFSITLSLPLFQSPAHISPNQRHTSYIKPHPPPDQSFHPLSQLFFPQQHPLLHLRNELFLEIRALWAQNELFMGGKHLSRKVCLMKNLCFEVQKARLKCGCYQLISRQNKNRE